MSEQIGLILRSPVLQRLGRGVAAQGYGHAVTIGLQLASVPILLAVWGEARYGSWLLLSVLTTYLTLSDLGFAQAATNDMTVSMSNGQKERARRTFHSLLALCTGMGGVVVVIGAALAGLFVLTDLLNLRGISEVEAKTVTLVLAVQVALAILTGGLAGALRAEGRFATMSIVNNSARLAEGLACLAAAFAGGGVIGAAVAMLVARCVGVGAFYGLLLRGTSEFQPGFADARFEELRRLAGPSLSYMAFPVGNALMIQGALTLVGLRIPAAVVLFSTSRTLARLATSILGSINHVFLFDYGRTLGIDDRTGFLRLLRLNGLIILGGVIAYVLFMIFFGPSLYALWTGQQLQLDLNLLVALVVLSSAEAIWAYVQTPLVAVNAHMRVTSAYLVGAVGSLAVGAVGLGHSLSLEIFVFIQAATYLLLTAFIVIEIRRRLRCAVFSDLGSVPR
jgi:O-antigen/teichoic acid export membrane protein